MLNSRITTALLANIRHANVRIGEGCVQTKSREEPNRVRPAIVHRHEMLLAVGPNPGWNQICNL